MSGEGIQDVNIDGKRFFDIKDAYKHYYHSRGHLEAKRNRLNDFHYENFPDPVYDFDLFADLAKLESYLKRPIDPSKTSVNHYNAIKKEAVKQYNNEKRHRS